jgi:hypothetical protein
MKVLLIPILRTFWCRKLYTAGDDSVIRVWDTSKDASQEPKVVNDADEGVTSLDCSVGHVHIPL